MAVVEEKKKMKKKNRKTTGGHLNMCLSQQNSMTSIALATSVSLLCSESSGALSVDLSGGGDSGNSQIIKYHHITYA